MDNSFYSEYERSQRAHDYLIRKAKAKADHADRTMKDIDRVIGEALKIMGAMLIGMAIAYILLG